MTLSVCLNFQWHCKCSFYIKTTIFNFQFSTIYLPCKIIYSFQFNEFNKNQSIHYYSGKFLHFLSIYFVGVVVIVLNFKSVHADNKKKSKNKVHSRTTITTCTIENCDDKCLAVVNVNSFIHIHKFNFFFLFHYFSILLCVCVCVCVYEFVV